MNYVKSDHDTDSPRTHTYPLQFLTEVRSVAISDSSFWTLASWTRMGKGTEREKLGAVLLPGIDTIGVVSVVSEAACVAV